MQRRTFLKSCTGLMGAAAFFPLDGFAAIGAGDRWINGFRDKAGRFGVAALDAQGQVSPLFYSEERLHGLAFNPVTQHLVAPARRPGHQLHIYDLNNRTTMILTAPEGRHYFGHGVFDRQNKIYYAVENDFDAEKGVIGVYGVSADYKRIGEIDAGGVGPHEIRLIAGQDEVIIANGGILTHPDMGRAKLNLETMAPNLSRLDLLSGKITAQVQLSADHHQLSLRHMDVSRDGETFVGAQDQDATRFDVALMYVWRNGQLSPLGKPSAGWSAFRGYIGSVTLDKSERVVCCATPRGGRVQLWDRDSLKPVAGFALADVCAVARSSRAGEFLVTTGKGVVAKVSATGVEQVAQHQAFNFDNHGCYL